MPRGYLDGMLQIILLLLAFVLFVVAMFGIGLPRVNLLATGLACWVLSALIGAWPS